MVDLKIRYNNENDEIKSREYNTIIDFINEMESDKVDIPMLDYDMVEATFFEKRKEYFVTIAELLEHCKKILNGWFKMKTYTQKELSNMFNTFLNESGFYDWEWTYGIGNLKQDVLIWTKGTPHQDILDWFDDRFENGLNEYIKTQWEFWLYEDDVCCDCPKLIDCSRCTFC